MASFEDMDALFNSLGFLSEAVIEEERQQKMIESIWRIVSNGMKTAKVTNIKAMMCAIQNFHVDWYINNSEEPFDKNKVGTLISGEIGFTSIEITHLTKKFLQLYKNRQNKF